MREWRRGWAIEWVYEWVGEWVLQFIKLISWRSLNAIEPVRIKQGCYISGIFGRWFGSSTDPKRIQEMPGRFLTALELRWRQQFLSGGRLHITSNQSFAARVKANTSSCLVCDSARKIWLHSLHDYMTGYYWRLHENHCSINSSNNLIYRRVR